LKRTGARADYEDVAEEIYRLREEKQKLQLESAVRDEQKKRIADMGTTANLV
jgi:site-specific DNA recombinase